MSAFSQGFEIARSALPRNCRRLVDSPPALWQARGPMSSPTICYFGATILTLDPARTIVEGDLVVRGGRIVAIGGTTPEPAVRVDCRGTLLVPGFVQTHVHLCQALFRGLAEEAELLTWLRGKIWPLEAAHEADSLAASARLGLTEAMKNGTTTVFDMGTVHHTDSIAE